MKSLFEQYATKRNLSLVLILAVLFNVLLLLYFRNFDVPILDTYMFYTSDEAYEAIGDYGSYKRQRYIIGTLMLDFIYPIFYCLMLAFGLFRLQGSVKLAIFPLFILPVDYLENLSIIFLLRKFPVRYDGVAEMAGIFTLTKWLMVLVSLIGIIALILFRVFKKRRMEKAQ